MERLAPFFILWTVNSFAAGILKSAGPALFILVTFMVVIFVIFVKATGLGKDGVFFKLIV